MFYCFTNWSGVTEIPIEHKYIYRWMHEKILSKSKYKYEFKTIAYHMLIGIILFSSLLLTQLRFLDKIQHMASMKPGSCYSLYRVDIHQFLRHCTAVVKKNWLISTRYTGGPRIVRILCSQGIIVYYISRNCTKRGLVLNT